MSEKVMNDLANISERQNRPNLYNILYMIILVISFPKQEARKTSWITGNEKISILFFGFIRKYKGLDLLLEAMADVKNQSNQTSNCWLPENFMKMKNLTRNKLKNWEYQDQLDPTNGFYS